MYGLPCLCTVVTALPSTAVHASGTQYWTKSDERVGIVEKVMNDGSISSVFNEGHMKVELIVLTSTHFTADGDNVKVKVAVKLIDAMQVS